MMNILKVLCFLHMSLSCCSAQDNYVSNLQSILSDAFQIYRTAKLSDPFDLDYLELKGGDVSTNYDIRAWDLEVAGISNIFSVDVNVTQNGPIAFTLLYNPDTIQLNTRFNLTGLLTSLRVDGQGTLNVIPALRHFTMLYRYNDEAENIVLSDEFAYYSNYKPKSFQFDAVNTHDTSYLNTIATAVSEKGLREMWQVYHKYELHQFLNCVLQTMTVTEILMGNELPLEAWNCAPTIEIPSTTSPDPVDNFSCTGRPDGYLPHLSDCSKFIACSNGAAEIRDCPFPLQFDHILLRCVSPNEARCLVGEFTCVGKPDGYFPNPENCSMYIRCLREQASYLSCPPPLVFDAVKLICVSPMNAICFK